MRSCTRGFSFLEVMIALVLVSVALVASLRLTVAVLGVVGKNPSGAAAASEQKPARLRSVAASWAQAELEFIKQIGFDNACAPSAESCVIEFPRNCRGETSPPPSPPSPYDVGPLPPPDFRVVRISVTWDPKTPMMPNPDNPSELWSLLRLVRVDVFRDEADCPARPLVTASTSLSRRR
ncbi:MAG: prepilin-type N-terminal cleavage/methylation domain-containing protein [bacterium]|nr:prepilin-type N-terminal cleavage/methylation domain-containing protein [bacterium]